MSSFDVFSCGLAEIIPRNLGQASGIVELPAGEKSSVLRKPGTMKIELEAAVEIGPRMEVS